MEEGTHNSSPRAALRRLLAESLVEVGNRLARSIVDGAMTAGRELDAEDPVQMRIFVHGPLADAVRTTVDDQAAERVIDHYELTRGLAEEADVSEPATGIVLVVSPDYSLRDRLENLMEVEGFFTQSAADANEALTLCRATAVCLMLLDEDADTSGAEGPYLALRHRLEADMPATVLLTADDDRPRPRCPTLSKSLDPLAVLEMVHALATAEVPTGSDTSPDPPQLRGWAGASPYAPLVYEALELVAAPELRDQLLAESLWAAGLEAVPTDRTLFSQFVNDALHRVIAAKLGEEDADAVVLDLQSTSGIHQRASVMANKRPSSIPPPEAEEIEQKAGEEVDGELSGIHRPGLAKAEEPAAGSDDHDEDLVAPEEVPSRIRSAPIKVLIADDDETLLGMLERCLDAAGFQVATATNGRDALSICLKFEPAVLVADMHMPVLNGRDVAQLLKRMREDRAPATILLTADPTIPRHIDHVAEVLGKPVRAQHLIDTIERVAGSISEKVV